MIPNYQGCVNCPLRDCPPVYGSGTSSDIVVIGEAPGATEVLQGRPFVGRSGELLRRTLKGFGINPDEIYYTNACLCRPIENETPSPKAIQSCSARLFDEISRLNPRKILTAGSSARQALTPDTKIAITKIHGLGELWQDRYVVSTYHPALVLRDPDLFRDFAADIAKFLSHDRPLSLPESNTTICRTPDEALAFLLWAQQASRLSCDLETTGFDFLRDIIYSIGFGVEGVDGSKYAIIVPNDIAAEPRVKAVIRSIISNGSVVFHNGKFDMQFLMAFFQDPDLWPHEFSDTMLMQYAQDERGSGDGSSGRGGHGFKTLGLKDQARMRYDVPDYHFDFKKFLELPGVVERTKYLLGQPYDLEVVTSNADDWDRLYLYQGIDCLVTLQLYYDLVDELDGESPMLMTLCRNLLFPATRALALTEWNGFPVDVEYFKRLEVEYTEKLETLRSELVPIAVQYGGKEGFLLSSPLQVRKVWKAMNFEPVTGAEREVLLLSLRKGGYPEDVQRFVKGVLEYRQMSGLLKTYITGVLSRVGPDDRVRPDFILPGADTGRLACRDPNLQNIPTLVGIVIRRGYVAPLGWKLVEVDYSQLELRIAAYYSRDEAMTRAFVTRQDLHRIVAANMFKKEPKDVTKLERYMAKYVDFGIIYGRSAPSLANGWEMEYVVEQGGTPWTVREAETFLQEFLNGFPGLRDWIKSTQKEVVSKTFVETPTGRRRRFPLISRDTVGSIERKAVNTPIQSLASDVCLWNMIALNAQLPRDEAQVVSTVHDAIYVLVRDDCLSKWVPFIIHTMSTNFPVPIDIPIEVEAKIGDRWGELKVVTESDFSKGIEV